jgi:RiboL-PSP-HEPN
VPSSALEALVGPRLEEVRALVALRPGGRSRIESAQGFAVNRAAVVLLCAHLEGFIEDLVGDCVDSLNSRRPDPARLPVVLKAAHVMSEVSVISLMTDVEKRAWRIERMFADSRHLWEAAELAYQLRVEVVTGEMSNPGAPEIARVLALLGMEDVFVGVTLPDEADIEKRVNELVGVRNSIAHGGADTKVTDDQVNRYVEAVEYLGRALDSSAASTVQHICESRELPWV